MNLEKHLKADVLTDAVSAKGPFIMYILHPAFAVVVSIEIIYVILLVLAVWVKRPFGYQSQI